MNHASREEAKRQSWESHGKNPYCDWFAFVLLFTHGFHPNRIPPMIVCVCNRVSDQQIREACEQGALSLDCLKHRLKVATCCGRCQDCARRVLDEAHTANSVVQPMAASA